MAAAVMAMSGQDAFKLLRVAKEGDTTKYKISASMQIQGSDVQYSASVAEKVTKVDEKGNYTVESTVSDGKIKFGDQEMPTGDAGSTTVSKTTPTGELIEVTGEGVDDPALRRSQLTQVVVPADEVKPGFKWSHESKAEKMNGNTAGKANYEIIGTEKVGSEDAIAIKFDFTETSGADPASSEGKVWISPKDGSMIKLEAQLKKAPIPEVPGGQVDMKITVEKA